MYRYCIVGDDGVCEIASTALGCILERVFDGTVPTFDNFAEAYNCSRGVSFFLSNSRALNRVFQIRVFDLASRTLSQIISSAIISRRCIGSCGPNS